MEKMNWKGKRVLITGVNGFIGSSVARTLLNKGAIVTGIVRDFNRQNDDLLANITVKVGDILDSNFVREAVSSSEADIVFHFAANAIVRIAARDPLSSYASNVMGTVNVLEACRIIGRCSRIVVASSDKAYGDHEVLPYKETHPLQPLNTYDASKASADMIARAYGHNYGMPVIVTRCSNVYGPGDHNFSRIVPNSCLLALEGKPPILYDDVEKMEREFIFIGDVVDAYERLALMDVPMGAYNIGTGEPAQIGAVAQLICGFAGHAELSPQIVKREAVFKEIQRQFIDPTKLATATGWRAAVPLPVGLERTVGWYKRFVQPADTGEWKEQ
ncbi:MAG: NAD-dependent epimerase/dehydratase family protein [Acidiferrobacterales bacterium]